MVAVRDPNIPQPPIHDYGVIGDGRSVALISRAGSLDWLCWPRFDSPPVFGRLLDPDAGAWSIAPLAPARLSRKYIEHSNVLETAIETATSRCVVVDAMTIASEEDKQCMLVADHEVLRIVRCERGSMELAIEVAPRPDFGRAKLRSSVHPQLGIRWQLGTRLLALRSEIPMQLDETGVARGRFVLRAGEAVAFSLTFDEEGPALLSRLGDAARERIERTVAWWQVWARRAQYDGPYREQVIRSALAIKLMSFAPSGAIVAAPTTSLPETLGGPRNWDYRYCWVRDAAFTARALLQLGYLDDAKAFCSWLLHTTRLTQPALEVLYDVYGNRPDVEHEIPNVTGYRGSLPVRVGNAAAAQLQLDCYGEVIDATAQVAYALGRLDRETQSLLRRFGDFVVENWRRPDQGIWETRGAPMHRTHSRLLCWVALDRLVGLCAHGLIHGLERDRVAAERAAIRADIEAHAFDPEQGAYTAAYGSPALDANVLLMTWYGFHRGDAPRMCSTYDRVRERLGCGPGLLYRNEASIPKREGAFWICSFWAVEHLAMCGGGVAEANALMRTTCAYANDLGLMAEELDPATGEALGNFPQAYTHVGLISAALSIGQRARHLVHHRSPAVAKARHEVPA